MNWANILLVAIPVVMFTITFTIMNRSLENIEKTVFFSLLVGGLTLALVWKAEGVSRDFAEKSALITQQQLQLDSLQERTVRLEKQNQNLNRRVKDLETQVEVLDRLEQLGPIEEKKSEEAN